MRRPRFFLNSILGVVIAAKEHTLEPPDFAMHVVAF
jgi:hypothetical protein